ncbi:hypothetical protein GCM10028794_04470 [Silanimonas algicola]
MLASRSPLLLVVLALAAGAAHAQHGAPSAVEARRSELPESVLRAERQTGGEVLRAESMQRDGREVYRLKVLTPDGRVRIMRDDPHERRREAWREARSDALRDPFADPEAGAGRASLEAPRGIGSRDDRLRGPSEERLERFDAPTPADLDVPETLPPVERGDRD